MDVFVFVVVLVRVGAGVFNDSFGIELMVLDRFKGKGLMGLVRFGMDFWEDNERVGLLGVLFRLLERFWRGLNVFGMFGRSF